MLFLPHLVLHKHCLILGLRVKFHICLAFFLQLRMILYMF